jgi:hypothetical protein
VSEAVSARVLYNVLNKARTEQETVRADFGINSLSPFFLFSC